MKIILTKLDHIAFGDYMNHARCIVVQLQSVSTNQKVARVVHIK